MDGIFISGILAKGFRKDREFDGKVTVSYVYMVVVDDLVIRITSDNDFTGQISMGDEVTFKVRVRAYNNTCYFHGDYIKEDEE